MVSDWPSAPPWLIAVFMVVGLAGIVLSFGSVGRLQAYFTAPSVTRELTPTQGATLGQAAGLMLRPFLGFGLIWMWCRWMDQRMQRRGPAAWRLVALSVPVIVILVSLSYATFGYNRGAFAIPIVALVAVYARRIR